MKTHELTKENERRNALLAATYDQVTGEGCCGERVQCGNEWVPAALLRDCPEYARESKAMRGKMRIRYDFEYWAATCCTIKDKQSSRNVPFLLNAPQRRLLAVMERDRQAGRPVRVVLLKARQWGGSTLVQMYMAWIQIVIHKQWNSLICGHLRQTSAAVKRMYNTLLRNYPREFLDEDVKLQFRSFEGSSSVQQLCGRDCLLVMGSSRSEDAVRGYDLALAHLTEVAFWISTALHSPEDVARSVSGTVSLMADTVVVYESTANGVGNYFHSEWLRAKAGKSNSVAVFVPWYEIEIYRKPVADPMALWKSMDDYERDLWDNGCTLEMINWYHSKRLEYGSHSLMMAEFPSNDIEAFAGTDHCVFDLMRLEAFGASACSPLVTGDITGDYKSDRNVRFVEETSGKFRVWVERDPYASARRYMVVVDVGGRSDAADYSVILVMDTHAGDPSRKPEVVAQWRGHIDHDLLAWKALQVARYYNNALLVVESNTLETEYQDPDAGEFILNQLHRVYRHMYTRPGTKRPGFQTNRKTKSQAIYLLIEAVRDIRYIERDREAINEMATYESNSRGGFEAKKGHHDDIVMTRAIALAVMDEQRKKNPESRLAGKDVNTLKGETVSYRYRTSQ